MSDPFRNDHDAAVARADALAADVERLEREKAELADKLAAAEAKAKAKPPKPPKPPKLPKPPKPDPERDPTKRRSPSQAEEARAGRRSIFVMVGIAVLIGVVAIVPSCRHKREHARWVVASELHKKQLARWDAYRAIGSCIRGAERVLAAVDKLDAETGDPRRHKGETGLRENLFDECDTATLAADETLSPAARDAFGRWSRDRAAMRSALGPLATYLDKGDWKDDDYASGPAKWASFVTARDALKHSVPDARTAGIPSVNQAIEAIAHAQIAGSTTYWTIELGARIEALDDVIETSTDRGRARELATKLLDEAKQAPLELRRAIRAISGLEDITHVEPSGYSRAPSNTELWGSLRDEHAPFPDPGSEPRDGCDGDGGGAT